MEVDWSKITEAINKFTKALKDWIVPAFKQLSEWCAENIGYMKIYLRLDRVNKWLPSHDLHLM